MKNDTIAKLGLCTAMEHLFGRDLYNYMEQVTEENDEFEEWQESLYDKNGFIQTEIKAFKNSILNLFDEYIKG